MNIPLLKKVRAAILKRPGQFEMASFFGPMLFLGDGDDMKERKPTHCGTAACIAGWAIHINAGDKKLSETDRTFYDSNDSYWLVGGEVLDISERQARKLFIADHWPRQFSNKYNSAKTPAARAKVAAARINHFIATKGAE